MRPGAGGYRGAIFPVLAGKSRKLAAGARRVVLWSRPGPVVATEATNAGATGHEGRVMTGQQRAGGATREPAAIERLLYGTDPTPRLVAVETAGSSGMRVYRRTPEDRVESTVEPFEPWLFLDREPDWPR